MNDEFENPLDKIIREARERGEFDQLSGKGKPLRWEEESGVPDDQRLANRIIKNSGFTLDWIQMGQDLDREHEELREALERARSAYSARRLDLPGWQAAARDYVAKARQLNQRVLSYNLRVPHERFQRRPYPIDPDLIDL